MFVTASASYSQVIRSYTPTPTSAPCLGSCPGPQDYWLNCFPGTYKQFFVLFILLLSGLFYFCVCVLPTCMLMRHMFAWYLRRC